MDVISRDPATAQSVIQQLINQRFEEFRGTLGKDITAQFEDQGERLKEAQRDLGVFKNAYSKAEQEKEALLKTIEAREKRVVVLIDGDGAIFLPSLIADGKQGGHEAASRLTKGINAHLDPHQFKLHVYVFHNRRGLTFTLKRHGHNEAAVMFDDFVVGFNQAAERFAIIDAGDLKEGSDHKIRAYLDDNIYSAQTLKVFFGGCHDNGYVTTLNSYITAGHKEKLILLPGYTDITVEIEKLGLPSLKISDLFLTEKLSQSSPVQRTIDPISVPTPPTSPPGLVHPSSIAKSTIGTYKAAVQSKVLTGSDDGYTRPTLSAIRASGDWRQVDYSDDEIMGVNGRGLRKTNPRLPLTKQSPPPCTLFYLAGCGRGSGCNYGHDYDLTEKEMDTLRTNAKNNPCGTVLKGEECLWDSDCIYGHVCPNAPRCHYNTAGRCKFYAKGMHTI